LVLALGIPILTTPTAMAATPQLLGIINLAPISNGNSYATPYQTTLVVGAPGVVGNDLDLDGDALEARLVSGPSHGSLTLDANGGFSYQPAAAWSGNDSFTYRAFDGSAQSLLPAVVSIVVGPAPMSSPTPTPIPTPSPLPTPTPISTPTPIPTPSPIPTPTPIATPSPIPTPRSTPTPGPTLPPGPSPIATNSPESTRPPLPSPETTVEPTAVPSASASPRASTPPPSSSPEPSPSQDTRPPQPTNEPDTGFLGQADDPNPPAQALGDDSQALFQEPDMAPVSFSSAGELDMTIEWVVPTFLITVPGFLIIIVGVAQALGGFVWLPLARRILSGDGRRRPT
jgi:hypothetical protein